MFIVIQSLAEFVNNLIVQISKEIRSQSWSKSWESHSSDLIRGHIALTLCTHAVYSSNIIPGYEEASREANAIGVTRGGGGTL